MTFNPYQEGFPVNQKFVLSKGEKDLSWIRPTSELKISISNSDNNQNKKQFLLEELYQQHADIAKDITKNGGGLLCTCWCVGLAIRRTRLGLEEDREGLAGC